MQPVPAPRHTSRSAVPADEPPAGLGRRAAAAALDAFVVLVLGGWLLVAWWVDAVRAATAGETVPAPGAGVAVGALLVLVVGVVQWVLHGRTGATLGRAVVGIRTLDVETREPVGVLRVLLRGLVVGAGVLLCVVGVVVVLLSPLFDRTGRRRGWHDVAAGDEVLVVRRGTGRRVATGGRTAFSAAPDDHDRGRRVRDGDPLDVAPDGAPQPSAAEPPTVTSPVRVPRWAAGDTSPTSGTQELSTWFDEQAGPGLVLAPLAPTRSGPDLDTRALPIVRATPPVPSAPVVPPVVGPPPAGSAGLDPELELTRPVRARVDLVPEPPPTSVERATALVELSDGRRLTVERTALVGRNPAAASPVQLIRVVDPTRSVSKTHLQIGVEPGGVWVADRGSTNGTVVTLPDGAQIVCQVDHQVRLRVGATVVFGDCWIRLVRAPGIPGVS